MADEDIDLGDSEAPDAGGAPSKKKGGGLGNLLPTILKFVAIGLGALVFIVTVSVITYNIMNRGGSSQTVIDDPSSPYLGKRPEYTYYDMIGTISVRNTDFASVTVEMIIGYDLDDSLAGQELTNRRFELRDFVRRYFAGKKSSDLTPDKEEALKAEIREALNTRFLDTARARIILFNRLDVLENY